MRYAKHFFLTAAMLLCSLVVVKAHDFEVGGIYYKITSTSDLTVAVTYKGSQSAEYTGEYSGAVTIPTNVTYSNKSYRVTSIGSSAFYQCSKLTSITIPKGVISIEQNAFGTCSSLKFVAIPNSVTSIGGVAFADCSSLTSITIPEGVSSIERYAFAGCSSLTSFVIPDGVISIGEAAFRGCSSLIAIKVPVGVTSIGALAFYQCSSLASITIPDGVTSIEYAAFYQCSSLASITIPNSVTSIAKNAFDGCTNLKELTIGSSVESIGNSAFAGCNKLESIYALNPKAITCDVSIFSTNAYNNATLYVPAGREQAYAETAPWAKFYIQTNHRPLKSFDVTIGSAGYATLFLDYAVERPRGVEAYYVSNVTGNHAVLKAVWDYIPANTGVILRGNAGTYTFAYTAENVAHISENMLRGTVVDTEIPAARNTTYYALGRVDGVVGLYAAKIVDGYFFNNANKAYLPLTTEAEEDDDTQLANQFVLRFPNGSTTSLAEVIGDGLAEDAVVYDLQGRRLKEITERGIYIVNGKKVVR